MDRVGSLAIRGTGLTGVQAKSSTEERAGARSPLTLQLVAYRRCRALFVAAGGIS